MTRKRLFTAIPALAALFALVCLADIPPIVYEIDSNFQQTQCLYDQNFVQGAGVVLQYRIKNRGRWYGLDGLGAVWQARSSSTSSNYIEAVATLVTNTNPDYFQIELDSNQTGSVLSNWVYSFIVTEGSNSYPLGTGSVNIAASTWTGPGATLIAVGEPTNIFDVIYLRDTIGTTNIASISFTSNSIVLGRTGTTNTTVIPIPQDTPDIEVGTSTIDSSGTTTVTYASGPYEEALVPVVTLSSDWPYIASPRVLESTTSYFSFVVDNLSTTYETNGYSVVWHAIK